MYPNPVTYWFLIKKSASKSSQLLVFDKEHMLDTGQPGCANCVSKYILCWTLGQPMLDTRPTYIGHQANLLDTRPTYVGHQANLCWTLGQPKLDTRPTYVGHQANLCWTPGQPVGHQANLCSTPGQPMLDTKPTQVGH